MGTESIFFVCGLVGALAGYIVGDFQRELRWRRDARENLRLAVDRLPVSLPVSVEHSGAVADSDSDSDRDSGAGRSLGSIRDGQARRRAVSRPNYGAGADPGVRGRRSGGSNAQAVGVGYDCG